MRKFSIFAATVAPLALLAACGDNDADEMDADADTTAMADSETNADAMNGSNTGDMTATRMSDAGDYSGVYSTTGADGSETALRLTSDGNRYEYVGADNEVRTGTYTLADDGYRLMIDDWWGEPRWFTFSNGELVALEGDTEITTDNINVTGERYTRAQESDAVFSRFPEPGSSVAPQN